MFYLSKLPNMAEDINKEEVLEEETLNQEEEGNEDTQEPKTYTEEEVEEMKRKMQSDSSKGVQKVILKSELFERAYKELPKISQDDTRLVEIYEENPTLAKKILEDHFGGQSIAEYKESIDYKEDYSDPSKMKAKIEREAEKLARKKLVESEKTAFIEKLQMTDEEKDAFESDLGDLLLIKKYQDKDIIKVMERAYKLSNGDSNKKLEKQEAIARTQASTKGGNTQSGKKEQVSSNPFDSFYKTHLNRNT